jgi:hypothetical protein
MNLWQLPLGRRELGRASTTGTPFGNSTKKPAKCVDEVFECRLDLKCPKRVMFFINDVISSKTINKYKNEQPFVVASKLFHVFNKNKIY